jgi:hypothetical protein
MSHSIQNLCQYRNKYFTEGRSLQLNATIDQAQGLDTATNL